MYQQEQMKLKLIKSNESELKQIELKGQEEKNKLAFDKKRRDKNNRRK